MTREIPIAVRDKQDLPKYFYLLKILIYEGGNMKKVFIKRNLPRIIFPEVSEDTGSFNRDLAFKGKWPLLKKPDERFNEEIKEILKINRSSYEN